jgi:DHA2 family multidrug resistance protein
MAQPPAASSAPVTEYNPWLIAMVVSLAAFMEVLDTTITNVSLSHIAGTLGASQDESTWVLTSYLVANGIILPLSGWLSGVLGRKRFFMICIGSFTAASLACGLSQSLGMLVFFRLLQGFAGGGLQPTQQAIILDAFPPEKRGAAFAVTGITMIVAPILGPTLGGYITDNFSWQWIFFMNVPVGIMAFFLVGRMVQDSQYSRAQGLKSIDYIGLSLVALGLGALQIVLDKGQQDDWFASHFIVFFASVSATCLISAVLWLLQRKDPVIDLRLLALPSFGLSCIMMFFTGLCLYAGSTLIPILVQSEYGYDATTAGLILSPGGLGVVILMPIAGRLVNYIPVRYLVAFGMACSSLGMWLTTHITPQSSYETFVFMRVIQTIGLPFLFVPISTLAFRDIPPAKSSNGSAIFAMSRNLGGSIGIATLTSFVTRHQQIHQTALAAHLNASSTVYNGLLNSYVRAIMDRGNTLAAATHSAMAKLYQELLHQSDILAFSDGFGLMAQIMGVLAIVALFMPYNDPHSKKNAAAAAAH